mmetsp:Transcript_12360/g.27111  ORF Transcript_12360/g.27111 Transcript_12360/m.27111 type:complete len:217 (-) Transcript_12360:26-676(-)
MMGFSNGKGGNGKGSPLRVQDPEKTVWIGGLPPNTHFKELLTFAQQVGPAKWAECRGSTAAIGYPSAQDAQTAMATLNGAPFKGASLQADKWTGKAAPKGGKGAVAKGGYGGFQVWKPQFQKSTWSKGFGKGKGKKKIVNTARTVWIGGIAEGTPYKELLELGQTVGTAKWAEVWKGTGAIGFANEEETVAAIPLLNGQVLGTSTIQADKWGTKTA